MRKRLYYKLHMDAQNPFQQLRSDFHPMEAFCSNADCGTTTHHIWFGPVAAAL